SRPRLAEHSPVVGRIANRLVAVLIASADLEPANERIVAELVTEIGPQRILLARAVLDVIHRRAPELEARVGEVLFLGRVGEGRAGSRPGIAEELRLARRDDRIGARNVEFLVGEARAE